MQIYAPDDRVFTANIEEDGGAGGEGGGEGGEASPAARGGDAEGIGARRSAADIYVIVDI